MALFRQENYDVGDISSRLKQWLDRLMLNIQSASHNNLNSKQGGTTGEYYHLTATELANVQALQTVDSSQIGARISLRS